jgi:hypothetical protein
MPALFRSAIYSGERGSVIADSVLAQSLNKSERNLIWLEHGDQRKKIEQRHHEAHDKGREHPQLAETR